MMQTLTDSSSTITANSKVCADKTSEAVAAATPELQRSQSSVGDSDDDSVHRTPSDTSLITSPAFSYGNRQATAPTETKEEQTRRIHHIDTLFDDVAPTPITVTQHSVAAPAISPPEVAEAPSSAMVSSQSTLEHPPQPSPSPVLSETAPQSVSSTSSTALNGTPVGAPSIHSVPSSTASTPASTPAATPQTYARKRGRPRKHPLPDPGHTPPPSKRKATDPPSNGNRKSATKSAGPLLSVPDLGKLIPQGSTSELAQNFISNNIKLFADLFLALQKQASKDKTTKVHDGQARPELQQTSAERPHESPLSDGNGKNTRESQAEPDPNHKIASLNTVSISNSRKEISTTPNPPCVGPSGGNKQGAGDELRNEVKKRMGEVALGQESLREELLKMKVEMNFFEVANKTLDERINVLRDRISKRTAVLQKEREANRRAREENRQAKKDRKAAEKSLKETEKLEKRLEYEALELERQIAAEEEERKRREAQQEEEEEGGDEDATWNGVDVGSMTDGTIAYHLGADPAASTEANPVQQLSTANDANRSLGMNDEELAKVLGITTSELDRFSQSLQISPLESLPHMDDAIQKAIADVPAVGFAAMDVTGSDTLTPNLGDNHINTITDNHHDVLGGDSFDLVAFLEMASASVGEDGSHLNQNGGTGGGAQPA